MGVVSFCWAVLRILVRGNIAVAAALNVSVTERTRQHDSALKNWPVLPPAIRNPAGDRRRP